MDAGFRNSRYFNKKNERVGALFQGTYKARPIVEDSDFKHCAAYVHRNPLDLMKFSGAPEGKGFRGDAKKFLREYKWSSYQDYIGGDNFPSVIKSEFLSDMFGRNPKDYEKFVLEWTEHDYARLKEQKILAGE